ncbi:PREDICTED: uncharacterized protein LOC109159522 [Ipomoea nil]|uniref:uncharacterized protein LOC109159522 n=1 Tax=Ipomoea nil TaxID=35883 RepID=UPI000901E325|nr:PREDICTED: uncharacterized protein LOC109159522 [Ipomoea nil]
MESREPEVVPRPPDPPVTHTHPQPRGAYRGRSDRGYQPNRAAAGQEHTVVRGTSGGRNITTHSVYHEDDHQYTPILAEFENTFKETPPDTDLVSAAPQAEDMHEDGRLVDHGAASSSFRCTFKFLLRIHKPSLSRGSGLFGGIWLLWQDSIDIEILYTHPQFVSFQVAENGSSPRLMSAVYGSPNLSLRKRLFPDLSGHHFYPQGPWLSFGDFNSVTSSNEVSNTEAFTASCCSDFNEWIFREGLVDLGFRGPSFTWTRGIDTPTFKGARLDRTLCNVEWSLRFPDTTVNHLPRIGSDHSSLLISTASSSLRKSSYSFKFNIAWAAHPSFHECVQTVWNNELDLLNNTTALAQVLPEWSRNSFGSVFQRKSNLLARLDGVQRCLVIGARADLLRLERSLCKELEETLHQEELIWFKRSREEWIVSGDRNTRFYQLATAMKRSHAIIP